MVGSLRNDTLGGMWDEGMVYFENKLKKTIKTIFQDRWLLAES
jgi:hypothetical protein